jgi:hypothetical protein
MVPNPKIVVGTGWWCSNQWPVWTIGDRLTRSPEFFALWYRQVIKCVDPKFIFVTDSHSPIKPKFDNFERVLVAELDQNYGHSRDLRLGNIKTKYCGFTRSVLMGAAFALSCDADYYVYVEQDCLLRGVNLLSEALGEQQADFLCGQRTQGGKGIEGRPATPMLQQSLMIATKRGLANLISKIVTAPEADGELGPELKMERDLAPFGQVLIPYGRSRPIDFSRSHFYAQHLTRDELAAFVDAERLCFKDWFPCA